MPVEPVEQNPQGRSSEHNTFAHTLTRIGEDMRALKAIKAQYRTRIANLQEQIAQLQRQAAEEYRPILERLVDNADALYTYAQAHRTQLTRESNTARFLTEDCIRWTQTPLSVRIENEKELLAFLKKNKIRAFIRVKEEINRQAMLAGEEQQTCAATLPGVSIQSDTKFSIIIAGADLRLETVASEGGLVWELKE